MKILKIILLIPLALFVAFLFFVYMYDFVDAGFSYIELEYGTGWAWAAVISAFVFRFSLPLTIFSFCGAYYLWHWGFFWALCLAMPGLLFMVPTIIFGLISTMYGKLKGSNYVI